MCGRYSIINDLFQIRTFFSIDEVGMPADSEPGFEWKPHYNAAPSQQLPVVVAEGDRSHRKLQFMKWGLVPVWAKPEDVKSVGSKMINARSETIAEKPSFKNAFVRRRCLVPVNSFYEWKPEGGTGKSAVKTPYRIFLKDQPLFAFAGIFEEWKFRGPSVPPDGVPARLQTFSVLTTAPWKSSGAGSVPQSVTPDRPGPPRDGRNTDAGNIAENYDFGRQCGSRSGAESIRAKPELRGKDRQRRQEADVNQSEA